jgi:hypothetical protein
MSDGISFSSSVSPILTELGAVVPVVIDSSKMAFSFLLIFESGKAYIESQSEWKSYGSKKVEPFVAILNEGLVEPAATNQMEGDAEFVIDDVIDFGNGNDILSPESVMFTISSKNKWTLPKAGSVKYDKAEDDFIFTNDENPFGVKLTYTSSKSTFKGKFYVYEILSETKLKKHTVNVTGVVIDGVGYGNANIKNLLSIPVFVLTEEGM